MLEITFIAGRNSEARLALLKGINECVVAEAQAAARDILLTTVPATSEGLATLVTFVIGNEHLLLDFHEPADTSELVCDRNTIAIRAWRFSRRCAQSLLFQT
jgi:hypothetical protein